MGGIIITGFVMMTVYLPVFHDLKLTSTYEVVIHTEITSHKLIPIQFNIIIIPLYLQYLQTRFDRKMRLFGCILFIFSQVRLCLNLHYIFMKNAFALYLHSVPTYLSFYPINLVLISQSERQLSQQQQRHTQ